MIVGALVVTMAGCAIVTRDSRPAPPDAEVLHAAVHQLSGVMVYDIFSPPQASRVYAYATVAAYEALRAGHPEYRSFATWAEKYRSNVARPETMINAYLDERWEPVLQTPPFPEYPSGHSVVSTAAATALTQLYGDSVAFVDSSEVEFGLPARSFPSFEAPPRCARRPPGNASASAWS